MNILPISFGWLIFSLCVCTVSTKIVLILILMRPSWQKLLGKFHLASLRRLNPFHACVPFFLPPENVRNQKVTFSGCKGMYHWREMSWLHALHKYFPNGKLKHELKLFQTIIILKNYSWHLLHFCNSNSNNGLVFHKRTDL